jgi:ATP-dependent helicase/nuclease subunit A
VHYLNYLRGALVGLSDPELLNFAQAEGSFSMDADVPDGLPEELHERVTAARQTALGARELLFNHTPSAALERLIEETGLGAYHAFEESGTTRAGSLARLTSMVRQWEADGWHWGRIVRELRALRDEQGYKQDGMTLDAGRGDVVRLMNLHQVKGLQSRVVFLVDCYDNSDSRHSPDWHVARTAEPPYAAIPIRKQTSKWSTKTVGEPAGWPEDAAREEAFLEAEKLRLVYVGATRAENMLIVTQSPGDTHRGPWKRLTAALDDVPALEAPEPHGKQLTLGANGEQPERTLDQVREQRRQQLARARVASYERATVSSEKGERTFADADAGRGKGRDYGTLVHNLLEAAVEDHLPANPEPTVETWLTKKDLDREAGRKAVSAVQRFRESALFRQAKSASVAYTEVPFAVSETGDAVRLLRGTIDLIYRDSDGWHIVDYKTDITTEAEARRKGYFDQLSTYARYWEELTGEAVASRSVYATQTGGGCLGKGAICRS